jgi:hypothetical protein
VKTAAAAFNIDQIPPAHDPGAPVQAGKQRGNEWEMAAQESALRFTLAIFHIAVTHINSSNWHCSSKLRASIIVNRLYASMMKYFPFPVEALLTLIMKGTR